jgi:hypothetical protein
VRLPRISPLYWEHLSRTTTKELALFGLIGVLFVVVALFEPYSTERPYTGEAPERVARDHLTLTERLGYAILLRAGYKEVSLVGPDGTPASISDPEQEVHLELTPEEHPELQCLDEFPPFVAPGVGQIDIKDLTIAIVAAEKYNRPSFQRQLEAWLAELLLWYRGKLPEFSFGLAQIRPATARHLLQEELGQFELSDHDLLALLMNNCHNVRIAAKYVEALCHQFVSVNSVNEIIAQVALTYSGVVTPTIQGLRYVDAVTGAYHLLEPQRADKITEDALDQGRVTTCISFGIGVVAAAQDIVSLRKTLNPDQNKSEGVQVTSEERTKVAEVHIHFWHNDPGPKAYVARLAAQRKDWLVSKLVEIGYTQERIIITELSSPKYLGGICEDSESSGSRAGIEVQQANGWEKRQ